jgi:hypothetical protein
MSQLSEVTEILKYVLVDAVNHFLVSGFRNILEHVRVELDLYKVVIRIWCPSQ